MTEPDTLAKADQAWADKQYAEAVHLYRLASSDGSARAAHAIAQILFSDQYVAKDTKEAMCFLILAAERGRPIAQYALGQSYHHGWDIAQDYTKAEYWFSSAFGNGYDNSGFYLGLYASENRFGFPTDKKKARAFYRTAAKSGLHQAQFNLGIMHSQGRGGPVDKKEAAYWFQKAADQNNAEAQFNLGILKYNGNGTSQSITEAEKLWKAAADQGHKGARENLEIAERNRQTEAYNKLVREYWEEPPSIPWSGKCSWCGKHFGEWQGLEGNYCSLKCCHEKRQSLLDRG